MSLLYCNRCNKLAAECRRFNSLYTPIQSLEELQPCKSEVSYCYQYFLSLFRSEVKGENLVNNPDCLLCFLVQFCFILLVKSCGFMLMYEDYNGYFSYVKFLCLHHNVVNSCCRSYRAVSNRSC